MNETSKLLVANRVLATAANSEASDLIIKQNADALKYLMPVRNVEPAAFTNMDWPEAIANLQNVFSRSGTVTTDIFASTPNIIPTSITAREAFINPDMLRFQLEHAAGASAMPPYRNTVSGMPFNFSLTGTTTVNGEEVSTIQLLNPSVPVLGWVIKVKGSDLLNGQSALSIVNSTQGIVYQAELTQTDTTAFVTVLNAAKMNNFVTIPTQSNVDTAGFLTFTPTSSAVADQFNVLPGTAASGSGFVISGLNVALTAYPLFLTRDLLTLYNACYYAETVDMLAAVINHAYAGF